MSVIKMLSVLTLAMLALAGPAALPAGADGPPFAFEVKKDRVFGATIGTLVFDADRVEFRTPDKDDGRVWTYVALKQIRVLSPTRVAIDTYEDRGRLRLGTDRTFEFEFTSGAVDSDLVAFLLTRIERPVVTAIMPPLATEPRARVPVKHQRRGRGSAGTLALYGEGLAYLTEEVSQARYWRFRDIASVLPLDRYRLEIRSYEGGSGTRPFIFELQTDLPDPMYDALWQAVTAPLPAGRQPVGSSHFSDRAPFPAATAGR